MSFLKKTAAVVLAIAVSSAAFSQNSASAAFVQGCDAYRSGDWTSAMFLLRKAVAFPENSNAETWYMLIASEMYAGEYTGASEDCDAYMHSFPDSPYGSLIMYQKGRALFYLGEYEKSVLMLSDFCHQHPDNEMFPSALFWIAESFYAGYNYEEAKALYQRIVNDFSSDAKAPAAQHRLETIAQRTREEKLLYLLKQTGEEYLASKEEYEKQLKQYNTEGALGVRQKLLDLQKRNAELQQLSDTQQERIKTLEEENKQLSSGEENPKMDAIELLKQKALEAQKLINQKKTENAK